MEKEDYKPESKPKIMLLENVLEYIETCYVNINEVSFLAVGKIYNL